jgi:hypothetical protein
MTADSSKYFPPNFATRQREEVDKLNALVDGAATAVANDALTAPIDSPAFTTLMDVPQHATTGAPAYAKGRVYFDTTANKLKVGGAAAYETVTSV